MPEAPSLLRTGLTVIWSFIVASVIWARTSSFYNEGTAAAANVFLPRDVWLDVFGRSLQISVVTETAPAVLGVNPLALHSGLLVVVALVAGTPWRSVTWRLVAGAYMAACFFLVQVIGMAIYALMLRQSVDGGVLVDDVRIGFAIFWGLTPMVIGGAWAYRFWLPAFRVQQPKETVT
jgi:hypothetical protein